MDFEGLVADRMSVIESSGIRKVFDLAAKLENPINLSIGQPDFDVPEQVREAAVEAIRSGKNKYTVTQGIPELRQAVLEREKSETHIRHDGVFITSGVSGGLLLSFMALLNAGDEILIPDPYFVMYKHLVRLLGAVPRFVNTYPDHRLTVERLEQAVTEKTKVLLVNSPANPTGIVLRDDELKAIAQWAEQRNIFIISDEIYRVFCYEGTCPSIARHTENVMLLSGFSKNAAMTGWRVGYAIGPEPIINEMIKLQQFTFVCSPAPAQYAALAVLDVDPTPYLQAYRRKRDIIYAGLRETFQLNLPEGAFYTFVKAPGGHATDFVKKAIEHNVLIIPGNVFSEQNTHFRIAYTATDEMLQKGVEVLTKLAR